MERATFEIAAGKGLVLTFTKYSGRSVKTVRIPVDNSGKRDTIYALASGIGRSAIAVIRVSGPGALESVRSIALGNIPPARTVVYRDLRDPETNEILDRAIVVWFAAPKTFSGEDMAEFHVTGGHSVVNGVLGALAKLDRLRPAEPGEFSRRAFESGKLDLTEVEGLASLVEAETSAQRRLALRIAGGALTKEADAIRDLVLTAMALVETQLDFSDIEDADTISGVALENLVRTALARIQAALACAPSAERLRDGLNVVIAGPPNVGKSSLMNALSRRDVSIVSPIAGTTRDVVEVSLDLSGYPVTLVDTAGLRESDDPLEVEGMRRALRRVENADLVLWLTESGSKPPIGSWGGVKTLEVRTKRDICDRGPDEVEPDLCALPISSTTGEGLPDLLDHIGRFASEQFTLASTAVIATERHRVAFRDAQAALERVTEFPGADWELAAEDLRLATRALERVAGRIDVEDVLGTIFSRFCVGK